MLGLKIYTKSGEALTSEEVEFAHRVAITHKEMSFGVITMTDPTSGVIVDYHAYNNTAFTSGDVGAYFGYDGSVDMRCWCRGIVLAETEAAATVSPYIQTALNGRDPWSYQIFGTQLIRNVQTIQFVSGPWNWWTGIRTMGSFDGSQIEWTILEVGGNTGGLPDDQLAAAQAALEFANSSNATAISVQQAHDAAALAAAQAAADVENARLVAEANQRSAVFLTDGTELGSAPISSDDDFEYNQTFPIGWFGGSNSPLATFVKAQSALVLSGSLNFNVPEDACFPPTYDGQAFMNTSTYKSVIFGSGEVNDYVYKEISYSSFDSLSGSDVAEVEYYLDTFYISGQSAALTRENARRKKCSDGQLAYLRNGFISLEFEYFIKNNAPKSVKLRRELPMIVVSQNETLVSDATDASGNRTRLWSADVTVKYDVTDDQGNVVPKQKTFTGTIQQVDTEHKTTGSSPSTVLTTSLYTYVDLPMLSGGSGKAYPLPSPLPALPYTTLLKLKTLNSIWHDDKTYPLLVIANGTFNSNTSWLENDTFGTASYFTTISDVNINSLAPVPQKTSDNMTFTHPQFLLDYIAASKPIEKELDVNGNKVDVTPSTDWLSSRLAHNEVVTIIPLSFVNSDGEDRGMYPLSRTDEVPAQIKLVGFAKVKYNYFTGSFTFVSWTEFTTEGKVKHDGNAEYNDETNPTSVNVGVTTYTLQPIFFDYDTTWAQPNCVCIAGKTPWTDTKAAYNTQKTNIADVPPDGYTLTSEESLYQEVRNSIK